MGHIYTKINEVTTAFSSLAPLSLSLNYNNFLGGGYISFWEQSCPGFTPPPHDLFRENVLKVAETTTAKVGNLFIYTSLCHPKLQFILSKNYRPDDGLYPRCIHENYKLDRTIRRATTTKNRTAHAKTVARKTNFHKELPASLYSFFFTLKICPLHYSISRLPSYTSIGPHTLPSRL